jgi:hypothetical protein
MCVVEGSLEEYALDESIDAQRGSEADARVLPEVAPESDHPLCFNPLRDEPSDAVVHAVQRFGVVGLVSCALGSGVLRWWKSLYH